jgi:hypothetical protein
MESEHLGIAKDPDGSRYTMEFYADADGYTANVIGPITYGLGRIVTWPTVHSEPATDPDDAFAKLTAWTTARGWPAWERDPR